MRGRQRAIVSVPAALKDSMWLPFLKAHDLISARIEVMSYDELRWLIGTRWLAPQGTLPRGSRPGLEPPVFGDILVEGIEDLVSYFIVSA